MHISKSESCRRACKIKTCGCIKEEVWIVPAKEEKSTWDCGFISKEIFVKGIGLKLIGTHLNDEEHFLPEDTALGSTDGRQTGEGTEPVGSSDHETENLKEAEYGPENLHNGNKDPDGEDDAGFETPDSNENVLQSENVKLEVCCKCGKTFSNKNNLRNHIFNSHSGTQYCTLCPEMFTMKTNLRRHMREVHRKNGETAVCGCCGKTMSRTYYVKYHEEKCTRENQRRQSGCAELHTCEVCGKMFLSKHAMMRHKKMKHIIQMNGGYILISEVTNADEEQFICKVCPVPKKFSRKDALKTHMRTKHDGRNDIIKYGSSKRTLSPEEVEEQESKCAKCQVCNAEFSCSQYLEAHLREVHKIEREHSCIVCKKTFKNRDLLRKHMSFLHRTPILVCPLCGKKERSQCNLERHVKNHKKKPSLVEGKPMSILNRSNQYKRAKKEIENIKRKLFEAPDSIQKGMWKGIIKDCPYYINKIKENPLTEEEVIGLIKDNNLSDRQVLNICHFLRQKWGREVISPNIAATLRKRKTILDQFFTLTTLNAKSKVHFKKKNGKAISRSVTYCHDLPGLIAFKKLVEDIDDTKEMMNVIGMDDGKKVLKIVWNWSLTMEQDKGKNKFMGPKRCIILAAVSKVKETHHNIGVLMEITKINEVEYALSMDLKLVNISIGICSHSSKYPCPYGECYKDSQGNWIKGQDRTICNIRENRRTWMRRSRSKKGKRTNLKKYMNCEFEPLINGDPEDPIIKTVPPPPLHTVLLGPVNHLMKELMKRYPKILKTLSNLHIQRSKYHGRSFEGKIYIYIYF